VVRIIVVISIFVNKLLASLKERKSESIDIIFVLLKIIFYFFFEYMLLFAYNKYLAYSEEQAE